MFRRKKSSSEAPRANGGVLISSPMPISAPSTGSAPLYERFSKVTPSSSAKLSRPTPVGRLSTSSGASGNRPTTSSTSSPRFSLGLGGESAAPPKTRMVQQAPTPYTKEKEIKNAALPPLPPIPSLSATRAGPVQNANEQHASKSKWQYGEHQQLSPPTSPALAPIRSSFVQSNGLKTNTVPTATSKIPTTTVTKLTNMSSRENMNGIGIGKGTRPPTPPSPPRPPPKQSIFASTGDDTVGPKSRSSNALATETSTDETGRLLGPSPSLGNSLEARRGAAAQRRPKYSPLAAFGPASPSEHPPGPSSPSSPTFPVSLPRRAPSASDAYSQKATSGSDQNDRVDPSSAAISSVVPNSDAQRSSRMLSVSTLPATDKRVSLMTAESPTQGRVSFEPLKTNSVELRVGFNQDEQTFHSPLFASAFAFGARNNVNPNDDNIHKRGGPNERTNMREQNSDVLGRVASALGPSASTSAPSMEEALNGGDGFGDANTSQTQNEVNNTHADGYKARTTSGRDALDTTTLIERESPVESVSQISEHSAENDTRRMASEESSPVESDQQQHHQSPSRQTEPRAYAHARARKMSGSSSGGSRHAIVFDGNEVLLPEFPAEYHHQQNHHLHEQTTSKLNGASPEQEWMPTSQAQHAPTRPLMPTPPTSVDGHGGIKGAGRTSMALACVDDLPDVNGHEQGHNFSPKQHSPSPAAEATIRPRKGNRLRKSSGSRQVEMSAAFPFTAPSSATFVNHHHHQQQHTLKISPMHSDAASIAGSVISSTATPLSPPQSPPQAPLTPSSRIRNLSGGKSMKLARPGTADSVRSAKYSASSSDGRPATAGGLLPSPISGPLGGGAGNGRRYVPRSPISPASPSSSGTVPDEDGLLDADPFAKGAVGVAENARAALSASSISSSPEDLHTHSSLRTRRRGEKLEKRVVGDEEHRTQVEDAAIHSVEEEGSHEVGPAVESHEESVPEPEEEPEEVTPPEPTFYPLKAHMLEPILLSNLLPYLEFRDWCALTSVNDALRHAMEHKREVREVVLERFLNTVGYTRWRFPTKELVMLTFRDLSSYMRGVSLPTYQFAVNARAWLDARGHAEQRPQDGGLRTIARAATVQKSLMAASCRAYTRVVLRLRAQAEALELEAKQRGAKGSVYQVTPPESSTSVNGKGTNGYGHGHVYKMNGYAQSMKNISQVQGRSASRARSVVTASRPASPTSIGHSGYTSTNGRHDRWASEPVRGSGLSAQTLFRSPLFRVGHAPCLRVFVPSAEGAWLSDQGVLDCESELKRAGVLPLLRAGDVVWDVAVGDEGNVGRLVWDGNYLIDLDYTYSRTGEVPQYLHTLAYPPSYFHRVIRTSGNPIIHMDISPWGEEVASNLQLLQDRIRTETPQGGRHTVVRWIHRSRFTIQPDPYTREPPPLIPGTNLPVDSGWYGAIVVETEGTNEGLADLQGRCPGAFPPRAGVDPKQAMRKPTSRVFRLLRERSRPGEIWLRAVREKERLL